jgi:O-antigen/teichoic acid export membrane protein
MNIKRNFAYSVAYQLLNLVIPILTIPYITRTLGAEGMGTYAYAYAIVYYFVVFAMLGIDNYGSRAVASARADRQRLSVVFTSLLATRLALSAVAVVAYIVFLWFYQGDNKLIFVLQIIYLLSSAFDVTWLFSGLEQFKITVIRNFIIKLSSIAAIFMFVRGDNALVIYTVIVALASLLTQASLWLYLKRFVDFEKVKITDCTAHLRPLLILFIPVIAVTIYKTVDRVILANSTDVSYVGLLDAAARIIGVPLAIITALGVVMLPRISHLTATGQNSAAAGYMRRAMDFSMFISFPIALGLIATAPNFIPVFLGSHFSGSIELVVVLALSVIFIAWANVLRTQYILPSNKDGLYIRSLLAGATVSVVTNFLLIPHFLALGAAIAAVCAEITVTIYQTVALRKELSMLTFLKDGLPHGSKALVMMGAVLLVNLIPIGYIQTLSVQLAIGVMAYGLLNIRYIVGLLKDGQVKQKDC